MLRLSIWGADAWDSSRPLSASSVYPGFGERREAPGGPDTPSVRPSISQSVSLSVLQAPQASRQWQHEQSATCHVSAAADCESLSGLLILLQARTVFTTHTHAGRQVSLLPTPTPSLPRSFSGGPSFPASVCVGCLNSQSGWVHTSVRLSLHVRVQLAWRHHRRGLNCKCLSSEFSGWWNFFSF